MNLDTLENVLLALLVADALALAVLVLIQQGKGADAGAAFGGGGSNTMFGGGGSSSFLVKLTSWLAIGFFAIAFGLAYTAKERAGSLSELGIPQITSAPLSGLEVESGGVESTAPAVIEAEAADSDVPSFEVDGLEVDGLEADSGLDVPALDDLDIAEIPVDGAIESAIESAIDGLERPIEVDSSVVTDAVESIDR